MEQQVGGVVMVAGPDWSGFDRALDDLLKAFPTLTCVKTGEIEISGGRAVIEADGLVVLLFGLGVLTVVGVGPGPNQAASAGCCWASSAARARALPVPPPTMAGASA